MGWFTGIIVYLLVFWTLLFAILPWGQNKEAHTEFGTGGSAPDTPYLGRKFLITALLSAVIWGVIYVLIRMEIVDFYGIARQMSQEDYQ